jgi:predicted  nucleic acid-binding Zn-ribbon protein
MHSKGKIVVAVIFSILFSASYIKAEISGKMPMTPLVPSIAPVTVDHTILKQRVTGVKNHTDVLENRLNAVAGKSIADRNHAWNEVHKSIVELKAQSVKISEQMASLKKKKLGKTEWAALNQTMGHDLRNIQAKMENIRQKYDYLAKAEVKTGLQAQEKKLDALREDIKSKRSEVESKFKAGEQARNSDYNTLISIIKTINEELGAFNKSMM